MSGRTPFFEREGAYKVYVREPVRLNDHLTVRKNGNLAEGGDNGKTRRKRVFQLKEGT